MKNLSLLFTFLGGAALGAGAALLFAPEKGTELQGQIKSLLKKYGCCKQTPEEEIDAIVAEIATEIKG